MNSYSSEVTAAYRVERVALLPLHQKAYYQERWALPRPWTDEDGTLVGSGGFFVSLTTGAIEVVGSGAWMYADWYLRRRDDLRAAEEPPPEELAELLANHSATDLFQMWKSLQRR